MKKLLLCSILIIVVTYVVSFMFTRIDLFKKFNFNEDSTIRVKKTSGEIIAIPFEDYIIGVVSGEMPASFDIEALKAQAVASRSYALTKMLQNMKNEYDVVDTISNQVYQDDDTLKSKWQSSYDANIAKIKEAVFSTRGEYLTYNGEVVNAFFFSTSTGKTENCNEIWGGNLPYLVSVDSTWDIESPVFKTNKTYSLNDFYASLDIPYQEKVEIDIIDKTSTGRIKKLKINNKEFNSSDIVKLLSLRSSYFEIEQKDNQIYINIKGNGHGVGMSQYGALGMAKEGYKYDEILKHYYTGVEISKM